MVTTSEKANPCKYLILGCGSVGSAVANALREKGEDISVVDIDKSRVAALRDQNFDAYEGDISNPDILDKLGIKPANFDAILILSADSNANKKAAKAIRKKSPDIRILARVSDASSKGEMEEIGVVMTLLPSEVVADAALKHLERIESARKVRELLKVLKMEDEEKLAIILHFNPEPDTIASALALQHIAVSLGTEAKILYHGEIGHQENRAFVNLLNIEMEDVDKFNLYTDFKKIALVDHAMPGVNNPLSRDLRVDVVIDHHPVDLKNVFAEYIDIRIDVGATATILTKYLQDLNSDIDRRLATALLYAIRVDTDEFKRNTHPSDLNAAAFLYPLADHEMLGKLEMPSMSHTTFDILGDAIRNRKTKGSYLVSNVGYITDRDALPQAADFLLNLEGITTVLVFGLGEDCIHMSARNKDIRVHMGNVLSRAFGDIGSAGGHASAAGVRIPLGVFSGAKDKQVLLKLAEEAVLKRFFAAVGVENESE